MKQFILKVIAIYLTAALFVPGSTAAQTELPAEEQLRLLEQLSDDQKRALLEEYGGRTGEVQTSQDVVFPDLVVGIDEGATPSDLDSSTDSDQVKPFGTYLFDGAPTTFAPATDVPVPPDYVLGPGDTIQVQFYGKENARYSFEITRDGILNLPELGPVSVVGLSFDEFRKDIEKRVANSLIGTEVSVSMGQLRSIRVFVLGDVNRPGSYVVSGLSTITHALFVSGGISPVGTMRNVQLKRDGKVVEVLDLYDLLLAGDTSKDARLAQGDVLFVPTIGKTVTVSGAIRRPAIYELGDEVSVGDILQLSGGLNAEAYAQGALLKRIADGDQRVVLNVDLMSKEGLKQPVADGDQLEVPFVLDKLFRQVRLNGHVYRPGVYAWSEDMRLADLIGSTKELMQHADLQYVLIRREVDPTLEIEVFSANLKEAWKDPTGDGNVTLKNRDQVFVFDLGIGRQDVTRQLIDELSSQARLGEFNAQVRVYGQVRAPGVYPLERGMRISDALRAAGDLTERAYGLDAELVRFEIRNGTWREAEVRNVDIARILKGDIAANLILQPYDELHIKVISEWQEESAVTLEGEFSFPGKFTLRQGETLLSVVNRAGGLTSNAFPEGAIFLREELKERERQAIKNATEKLQQDLAALAVQGATSGDSKAAEALNIGNGLLAQLQAAEATGRLVIPLELIAGEDAEQLSDFQMKNGDRILMPGKKFEVTVIGEVQQPTSHLFEATLTRDDYLDRSGGLTRKADKKNIYVVRASGAVVGVSKSRWLGRNGDILLKPGDTIVVPVNADKIRPMAFWTGVTQIVYQAAISVAAVKTFNR